MSLSPLFAQSPDSTQWDARVQLRKPDFQAIEQWKKEQAFQYQRPKPPEESWFSKLQRELKAWIERILGKEASNWIYQNWAYFAIFVVVFFLVWRIIVSDRLGLFSHGQSLENGVQIRTLGDIHGVDFMQEIQQATEKQQYREAIRLHYLHLLKELQDRKWIQWKRDKTNQDYLRELQKSPFSSEFAQLTHIFEHIFYGEMPISEMEFSELQTEFIALKKLINETRVEGSKV